MSTPDQPPTPHDPLDHDSAGQLRGMAAAVDRANRPLWLLAVGAVVITLALVFVLVAAINHTNARSRLAQERRSSLEISTLLTQIKQAEENEVELGQLFPRTLVEVKVREVVDALTREFEQRIDPEASTDDRPQISVGTRLNRDLASNQSLRRSDVSIGFRNFENIADITELIRRIQTHPELRTGFIAKLRLQPIQGVWRGELLFRTYEIKNSQ